MAAIKLTHGLRQAMEGVLVELRGAFSASRATMVFEDLSSGGLHVWSLASQGATLQYVPAPPSDRDLWWFPVPVAGSVWFVTRRRGGLRVVGDGPASYPSPPSDEALARCLGSGRRLIAGEVRLGDEWRGRLFLHDPSGPRDHRARRWLAGMLPQVGSALYSLYLLGRLRERATAVERTRIARELHDGLIQSLVGLEMRLDVLRRRPGLEGQLAGELAEIQEQLHEEAVGTRELMQQIRPVEADGRDLPDLLASMADRYRRDTGIDARFTCEPSDVRMPPRVARELVRVAQEALVNARKHSRARHVVVELREAADAWRLTVDDDGRGFEFEGRFTLDELDRARRGPLVIKQRVRGMGGSLTLDSSPGRGTRLEVTVPRSAP
jgi:signal transduction histidine kinase